jgi:hypothetical protein
MKISLKFRRLTRRSGGDNITGNPVLPEIWRYVGDAALPVDTALPGNAA